MHPGDDERPDQLRVTDRRRFTETGEMRDGGAADEPTPEPVPTAPTPAPAASRAAADPVDARYEREGGAPRASGSGNGEADPVGERGDGAGQGPGAFDLGIQAVFYIFWQSAMIALGASEPGSVAPAHVDLAEARQAIAFLKILEDKTSGNLDPEEAETLRQLLHDAQLRYVQVARTMPGGGA